MILDLFCFVLFFSVSQGIFLRPRGSVFYGFRNFFGVVFSVFLSFFRIKGIFLVFPFYLMILRCFRVHLFYFFKHLRIFCVFLGFQRLFLLCQVVFKNNLDFFKERKKIRKKEGKLLYGHFGRPAYFFQNFRFFLKRFQGFLKIVLQVFWFSGFWCLFSSFLVFLKKFRVFFFFQGFSLFLNYCVCVLEFLFLFLFLICKVLFWVFRVSGSP